MEFIIYARGLSSTRPGSWTATASGWFSGIIIWLAMEARMRRPVCALVVLSAIPVAMPVSIILLA